MNYLTSTPDARTFKHTMKARQRRERWLIHNKRGEHVIEKKDIRVATAQEKITFWDRFWKWLKSLFH